MKKKRKEHGKIDCERERERWFATSIYYDYIPLLLQRDKAARSVRAVMTASDREGAEKNEGAKLNPSLP